MIVHDVDMALELAGFQKELQPGAKIETPKAFLATFTGGVDELGNQLLDWQYAILVGIYESRLLRQDTLGSRLA